MIHFIFFEKVFVILSWNLSEAAKHQPLPQRFDEVDLDLDLGRSKPMD